VHTLVAEYLWWFTKAGLTLIVELDDILSRETPPRPWSEGEKIPWNEPGFSRRMLKEHLSQDHDAASRRFELIDRHVHWIHQHVLAGKVTKILDLGCGPGFYTQRFARLGHECVGIDFSPASIAYAKKQAAQQGLSCRYDQADFRVVDYGLDYGLVMLIFGEYNVFKPQDARTILAKVFRALRPGGILLLETHTFTSVQEIGSYAPTWYSSPSGLFSDHPHLYLQENFWDRELNAATTRYYIIDVETGAVSRHAASMQAYTGDDYRSILTGCGFKDIEFYPSLLGDGSRTGSEFLVFTSRKDS